MNLNICMPFVKISLYKRGKKVRQNSICFKFSSKIYRINFKQISDLNMSTQKINPKSKTYINQHSYLPKYKGKEEIDTGI